MVKSDLLLKYYEELDDVQVQQLMSLADLYKEWNERINVVSRKDIDSIIDHHIIHALSLTKFFRFVPGTQILDLGTGGGLPGLPLAIFFPEVQFTLIDARSKKIHVVNEIVTALKLQNVEAIHVRAEDHKKKYDYVVTRAVAQIDKLWAWSYGLIDHKDQKNIMPNGLLAYKGGDLKAEMKKLSRRSYSEIYDIIDEIDLPYYEEKAIVYVQR